MAKKKPKGTWRSRHTQIAVYAKPVLYNMVLREAQQRRRGTGATVVEILWEYFKQKESDYPKFADA